MPWITNAENYILILEFQQYMQFKFYEQWMKLEKICQRKRYPDHRRYPDLCSYGQRGYRASSGAFQLDEENVPVAVAGCPPDGFSATGQLWGNPLYRWITTEIQGYQWWISRLSYVFRLYDVVRIDHFRGFDEYFPFRTVRKNAISGHWEKVLGLICSAR